MTAVLTPREQWNTMPGWGIVANLLPPELLDARRARAVRQIIAAAAVAVVVLALLAYGYETLRVHSAASALNQTKSTTATLTEQESGYNDVVSIQSELKQIGGQIAGVMAADVQYEPVIAEIRNNAVPGMAITQLTVATSGTGTGSTASGSTSTTGGSGALDTSGQPHIGTISLTGTALKFSDVSTYVDRLSTLTGLVQVYPSSSAVGTGGVQFSLNITLSNKLLSHKYDITKTSK